jgi:hypothetical protein
MLSAQILPGLMQIQFLLTKRERFPAFAKRHHVHTKHLRIKLTRDINVSNRQNDMINAGNFHVRQA